MTPEEIYRLMSSPTSLVDTSTSLLNHYREGTPLLDKDRSIIAQSAGKDAAELTKALIGAGEVNSLNAIDVYDNLKTAIFNSTLALAGAQAVVESFEGNSSYESSAPAQLQSVPTGGGRPHADVEVKVGKYRGKTIGAIFDSGEDGAGWLDWASKNLSNDWLKGRISEFLAA